MASKQIGFIGAGQMARALALGFVKSGAVTSSQIVAADCAAESRAAFEAAIDGATVTDQNEQVLLSCEIVFLAVKPQHLPCVLAGLTLPAKHDPLYVSIAAGIPLDQLTDGLQSQRVIRVMPNTPALIGQAASAFCRAEGATEADGRRVTDLLATVGQCWELPETSLDAVTGLSGSGPAFVFLFIEALSDGGVRMGLPRDVALQLAAQTVQGAAQMVLKTGDHPAVLKDRVASPGGTTIAGLEKLEQAAFRASAIDAVRAATERSREMGQ